MSGAELIALALIVPAATAVLIALVQKRPNQVSHVILCCFKCKEYRRLLRMGKTGGLGDQGPEKVYHAPGQAANSGESNFSPGAFRWIR